MEKRIKEKIDCFEDWMKGDHVMIHLDATATGVCVPAIHSQNSTLALQLSYAFRGETTHDDSEIRSFLKFQGEYFECIIPWNAVWGISSADGDSRLWPQDMPREMLAKIAQSKLQEVGKKVSSKLFGKRTAESKTNNLNQSNGEQRLSALKDVSKPDVESTSKQGESNKKTGRQTPQLKRIK